MAKSPELVEIDKDLRRLELGIKRLNKDIKNLEALVVKQSKDIKQVITLLEILKDLADSDE